MATKKPISPDNALYRLAALCSRGEQAESDCRTKLASWGIMPADADAIIDRLIDQNFLNEERYARAFVRDKFRFGGWGRIKIAFSLRQKGVGQNTIDDALTEISDQEYADTLQQLLTVKARSVARKEYLQAKASLIRFAASRGFESDLIYRLIPQVLKRNDNDDDDDF